MFGIKNSTEFDVLEYNTWAREKKQTKHRAKHQMNEINKSSFI